MYRYIRIASKKISAKLVHAHVCYGRFPKKIFSKLFTTFFLNKWLQLTQTNYKILRVIGLPSNLIKLIYHIHANSNMVPSFWNMYIKGQNSSSCLRSFSDHFENSTRFGVKTVMVIHDIVSVLDGCSWTFIPEVLSQMGFGDSFLSKILNPY